MSFITHYWKSLNFEQLALSLTSKLIACLLLFIAYLITKRIAHYLFRKAISKSVNFTGQSKGRQETLIKLSQNMMDYTITFFFLYWILAVLGVPISSLLAGAGIAGLAVGLGAQGFLSDLVNGFFILFERQYDVGDSIQIGSISGVVTNVGLRTTQVSGADGTVNFIPNRNITTVSNLSRANMRVQIDLPIPFNTDLDAVSQLIEQVNQVEVKNYSDIIGKPVILGGRISAGGQFVFRVDITTKNGQQSNIYYTFFKHYQEALKQNHII